MGDSQNNNENYGRQWRQLDAFLFALSHSANRLDGLENVKELIANNNAIPSGDLLTKLIKSSCNCASDPNSRIANRWLQFLAELVAQYGGDLTPEIPKMLPVCVTSLGAISGSVRRASVQLLSACAKVPDSNPRPVLQCVADGIKDSDEGMRTECCSALVTVYSGARYKSPSVEAMMLQDVVVPALVPALGDASPKVVAAATTALDAVRWRAPDTFEASVTQLPPSDQQQIMQRLGQTPKATPKAPQGSSQVLRAGLMSSQSVRSDIGGSSKLIGVDGAEQAYGDENGGDGVVLGFIPGRLIGELQDANNWRVRALAVEELQTLVKELKGPAHVRAHVAGLIQLLLTLLGDVNFKIEITALQTLGDFIALLGQECRPFSRALLQQLAEKLGDNKTLVRQANAKVIQTLMRTLGPEAVLPSLVKDGGQHENWRVREEVLTLAMIAVLTFPDSQLPMETLVGAFHACLDDQKPKVKFTAIEALALLHAKLGQRRLGQLLPEIDARHKRMLDVRFAQPQLPSVNADGHLELPPLPRPLDDSAAPSPVPDGGGEGGGGRVAREKDGVSGGERDGLAEGDGQEDVNGGRLAAGVAIQRGVARGGRTGRGGSRGTPRGLVSGPPAGREVDDEGKSEQLRAVALVVGAFNGHNGAGRRTVARVHGRRPATIPRAAG